MYKKIAKILVLITFSALLTLTVSASGFPEFEEVGGYKLRVENISMLAFGDALWANTADSLMLIIANIGWVVIQIFSWAMNANLAETLGGSIDRLVKTMHEDIFMTLFILGAAMSSILIIRQLAARNFQAVGMTFVKIFAVYVLSFFVVANASSVLIAATNTSIGIGLSIMDVDDTGTYTDDIADELWDDLVYDFWKQLQFMKSASASDNVEDSVAEAFLARQRYELVNTAGIVPSVDDIVDDAVEDAIDKLGDSPYELAMKGLIEKFLPDGKTEGKATVDAYIADNEHAFNPAFTTPRIGYLLVYLPAFTGKCFVFLTIALLLVVFQVVSIFFVIIAPLILICSLFPTLGGVEVLNKWFRSLLETQVMIILIMFLLYFIRLTGDIFSLGNDNIGLSIATTYLQAIVAILLLFKHKKVLKFFGADSKVAGLGAGSAKWALGSAAAVATIFPRNAIGAFRGGVKGTASGAGTGASVGGAIGTVAPVVGNVVGAVAGGVIGADIGSKAGAVTGVAKSASGSAKEVTSSAKRLVSTTNAAKAQSGAGEGGGFKSTPPPARQRPVSTSYASDRAEVSEFLNKAEVAT
ncbi:MAG: hypothetical protein FWG45_05900 [Oscillospiraceae bacterium]|nr:hypothetical protein [Oscillospiraceae bacterium]